MEGDERESIVLWILEAAARFQLQHVYDVLLPLVPESSSGRIRKRLQFAELRDIYARQKNLGPFLDRIHTLFSELIPETLASKEYSSPSFWVETETLVHAAIQNVWNGKIFESILDSLTTILHSDSKKDDEARLEHRQRVRLELICFKNRLRMSLENGQPLGEDQFLEAHSMDDLKKSVFNFIQAAEEPLGECFLARIQPDLIKNTPELSFVSQMHGLTLLAEQHHVEVPLNAPFPSNVPVDPLPKLKHSSPRLPKRGQATAVKKSIPQKELSSLDSKPSSVKKRRLKVSNQEVVRESNGAKPQAPLPAIRRPKKGDKMRRTVVNYHGPEKQRIAISDGDFDDTGFETEPSTSPSSHRVVQASNQPRGISGRAVRGGKVASAHLRSASSPSSSDQMFPELLPTRPAVRKSLEVVAHRLDDLIPGGDLSNFVYAATEVQDIENRILAELDRGSFQLWDESGPERSPLSSLDRLSPIRSVPVSKRKAAKTKARRIAQELQLETAHLDGYVDVPNAFKQQKKRITCGPDRQGVGRWTQEEVDQLKRGVATFGVGKWAQIMTSFEFLEGRTTVNLKDKWRNLEKYGNV